MNAIKRKTLIIGSISGVVATGIASGVAVSIVNANNNKPKYDFGLVVSPVNSLNYAMYTSSRDVVASTIPSLFITRPKKSDKLSALLLKENVSALSMMENPIPTIQRPRFIPTYESIQSNTFDVDSFDSYYLKNFDLHGEYGNLMANASSDKSVLKGFSAIIDKSLTWNDGTHITASAFIDYINYILDENNASDLINEVLSQRIAGVDEYINAQKEYFVKYNQIYANPSGVNNPTNGITNLTWPSQVDGDSADVMKIETAYKSVQIYGDEYSSRPFSIAPSSVKVDESLSLSPLFGQNGSAFVIKTASEVVNEYKSEYKNTYPDADTNDSFLTIQYLDGEKTSREFYKKITQSCTFMPINKKSVNSLGGISKFGNKIEGMPYIGAYKFDGGVLGKNGSLVLRKNDNFIYKSDVFSNKIKLYFSTDPNVNYAMFKDGSIASTQVPTIQLTSAFSDLDLRKYLNKKSNSSTEGISFNLDKTTRKVDSDHDPLQYPSFRKAIFYAIDREQVLKILQQDSSLVKSNFSSSITVIDGMGNFPSSMLSIDESATTDIRPATITSLDSVYRDSTGTLDPTINTKITPLQGYETIVKQSTLLERYSIDFMFESVNRKDKTTNVELANKFLDIFKQEYKQNTGSDFGGYELEYIYGNGEEGENLGISLQNQLKDAFNSQISVKLKGFSNEIYTSYVEQGKFDIIYKELAGMRFTTDVYDPTLFIKKFLIHDDVSKGYSYYNNPTGGWTFDDFLDANPKGSPKETDLLNRLHIHKKDMDVMREILKFTPYEIQIKNNDSLLKAEKERIVRLKEWLLSKEYRQGGSPVTYDNTIVTNDYKRIKAMKFNVLAQFDKLVMESSPVIPMTIGGQGWELNRLSSYIKHGTAYQFEFGFDKANPPKDELRRII